MAGDGAERIVIVGASLAGLRAAEALRQHGFTGTLTIVGDEDAPPYDRPPLSKQVLTGWIPAGHAELARLGPLDGIRWRLGTPAAGLDRDAKEVVLADGSRLPYDKVLIATGVRSRPWPQEAEAALDGVCAVRTQADAAGLAARLDAGPRRVLVIGAGFTGSEIASACRHRGIDVTVVERGEAPLAAALGGVIGDVAARLHRRSGVDLRCEVTVTGLHGSGGQVTGAALSDGSDVPADVVVVALGAVRNTEWLAGSGLAAGPLGVSADAGCRAIDVGGLVTDDVFVAGDVARFAHALFGYQYLALEHWENAVVGARVAAHNMLCPAARRRPHACVPTFWSVQFDTNIKSAGVPALGEEIIMTHGSPEDASFAAAYGDADGRIVGAVTVNHGRYLDHYRRLIEQAAPLPGPVGENLPGKPEPARFPHPAGSYHGPSVIVTGHSPTDMTAVAVPAGRSAL